MKILAELREQGRAQDMQALVDHIPYARFLGIRIDRKGNEITTSCRLPTTWSATFACARCTAA